MVMDTVPLDTGAAAPKAVEPSKSCTCPVGVAPEDVTVTLNAKLFMVEGNFVAVTDTEVWRGLASVPPPPPPPAAAASATAERKTKHADQAETQRRAKLFSTPDARQQEQQQSGKPGAGAESPPAVGFRVIGVPVRCRKSGSVQRTIR